MPCNTMKGGTLFGRLAMKVAKRRVCTRNPPGSRKAVKGVPCPLVWSRVKLKSTPVKVLKSPIFIRVSALADRG